MILYLCVKKKMCILYAIVFYEKIENNLIILKGIYI